VGRVFLPLTTSITQMSPSPPIKARILPSGDMKPDEFSEFSNILVILSTLSTVPTTVREWTIFQSPVWLFQFVQDTCQPLSGRPLCFFQTKFLVAQPYMELCLWCDRSVGWELGDNYIIQINCLFQFTLYFFKLNSFWKEFLSLFGRQNGSFPISCWLPWLWRVFFCCFMISPFWR